MASSGLVSPLDFRYGRQEIKRHFTQEARLRYLLSVEAALAQAHARVGNIPKTHAKEIHRRAHDGSVKPARVSAIEARVRHDLMAVVHALTEKCSKAAGAWVHLGATSYDIIDTANALQFRDALEAIEERLRALLKSLVALARRHKRTVMLGRTHGQAAIPITFGFKMIVFAAEVDRHLARLNELRPRVLVGKMSGAVGSAAGLGPHAQRIERLVMAELGLKAEEAATQIVQRDRYIELFAWLANVATSMEKFATEIRNLQRTEIAEAAEGFDVKRQVGSSTMAQKRNPVNCEQVSGLARLIRSQIIPVMENAIQWHERDLANSAPERFLHPYALILTDWIVHKMVDVFTHLVVDKARMKRNLEATGGSVMAESLLLALTRAGVGRQDAHEHVRRLAHASSKDGAGLREAALNDDLLVRRLGKNAVIQAMDPSRYLGRCVEVVQNLSKELGRPSSRR